MKRDYSSKFAEHKLMRAVIEQAKKQNVWVEPDNVETANTILSKVDLSQLFPRNSPHNRVRNLERTCWSTLANCHYKMLGLRSSEHGAPDHHQDGGGDDDDDEDEDDDPYAN